MISQERLCEQRQTESTGKDFAYGAGREIWDSAYGVDRGIQRSAIREQWYEQSRDSELDGPTGVRGSRGIVAHGRGSVETNTKLTFDPFETDATDARSASCDSPEPSPARHSDATESPEDEVSERSNSPLGLSHDTASPIAFEDLRDKRVRVRKAPKTGAAERLEEGVVVSKKAGWIQVGMPRSSRARASRARCNTRFRPSLQVRTAQGLIVNTRMCELEAIPDHIDSFASVATENENTALRSRATERAALVKPKTLAGKDSRSNLEPRDRVNVVDGKLAGRCGVVTGSKPGWILVNLQAGARAGAAMAAAFRRRQLSLDTEIRGMDDLEETASQAPSTDDAEPPSDDKANGAAAPAASQRSLGRLAGEGNASARVGSASEPSVYVSGKGPHRGTLGRLVSESGSTMARVQLADGRVVDAPRAPSAH